MAVAREVKPAARTLPVAMKTSVVSMASVTRAATQEHRVTAIGANNRRFACMGSVERVAAPKVWLVAKKKAAVTAIGAYAGNRHVAT
jgi:uncharacterized Zn-finger protein